MTKAQWKTWDSILRREARRLEPIFEQAEKDLFIYGTAVVVFPDDLNVEPYTIAWSEGPFERKSILNRAFKK